MRTHEELKRVMIDFMTPEEIVEAIGITAEDLTECLDNYIELNYETVHQSIEAAGFSQGVMNDG